MLMLALPFLAGLGLAFVYSRTFPAAPQSSPHAAQANASPAGLEDDPDMRMAEQAFRERRFLDTVRCFEAASMRHPARVEPLLGLTRVFLDVKRIDDALRSANAALQIAPADARVHLAAGKTHYAAGDLASAEQHFARVTALDASNAEAAYYAGRIAADKKQFEAAIAAFRRALALDPGLLQAAHDLATHLMEASDFAGAEQVLAAALARAPDNLALQLNHARLFLRKGDAPRAVEAYAAVLPKLTDVPVAQNDYGQALLLAGRDDDALAAFRKAADMDPALPDPWYGIGQLLQRRDDRAGAEKAFERFRQLRELKRAMNRVEFRLRNAPRDVEALVESGRLLLQAGKPKDAVTRLRLALSLSAEAGQEHPVARQLFEQAARALGVEPNAE